MDRTKQKRQEWSSVSSQDRVMHSVRLPRSGSFHPTLASVFHSDADFTHVSIKPVYDTKAGFIKMLSSDGTDTAHRLNLEFVLKRNSELTAHIRGKESRQTRPDYAL